MFDDEYPGNAQTFNERFGDKNLTRQVERKLDEVRNAQALITDENDAVTIKLIQRQVIAAIILASGATSLTITDDEWREAHRILSAGKVMYTRGQDRSITVAIVKSI